MLSSTLTTVLLQYKQVYYCSQQSIRARKLFGHTIPKNGLAKTSGYMNLAKKADTKTLNQGKPSSVLSRNGLLKPKQQDELVVEVEYVLFRHSWDIHRLIKIEVEIQFFLHSAIERLNNWVVCWSLPPPRNTERSILSCCRLGKKPQTSEGHSELKDETTIPKKAFETIPDSTNPILNSD